MEISKFPEILGELSIRKQCVPGSFFSAHALEPGNEATCRQAVMQEWNLRHRQRVYTHNNRHQFS